MKTPAFKQLNAKDRDLSLVQGNVAQKLNTYDLNPFLGGNLLTDVVVTNATDGTAIAHGLTVQPLGWIVVDKTSVGDVIRLSWTSKFITLKSSSVTPTTLSLWVF